MAAGWVLVLDPPRGDASRRVGGLSLALRLALDAQSGGAEGVVLGPQTQSLAPLLADARLRLPIHERAPQGSYRVRIGASTLAHRLLWKALAAAPREPGGERDLGRQPLELDVPFGFAPIDVVDARTERAAERALFRSLRKPQDGWTSRWLNRHLSLALSRLLVRTPLTPNQVSLGILAVGLAGAWLASRGTSGSLIAGAALFQAQSVLDGCDGEMSRVTHRGSLTGEWLDTVGDDLTNYGFFGGAAWGLFGSTGNRLYLVAGAVTVACGLIASAVEYRYLVKIGSGDLLKYPISAGSSEATGLFAAIQPLFKRDTFVFLTLLAAVVGLLGPMLLLFAVAAVGIVVSVALAELRMARERRALPKEQS